MKMEVPFIVKIVFQHTLTLRIFKQIRLPKELQFI